MHLPRHIRPGIIHRDLKPDAEPYFDAFRADARYRTLLARMNLGTNQKTKI